VLNALRHQRFGHDHDLPQVEVLSKVLNALRHQRFGHSQVAATHEIASTVLNALRHQRFGHPWPLVKGNGMLYVLNALRHQRFGHLRAIRDSSSISCAQRLTASEVWAPGTAWFPCIMRLVLNALRHQRFGHRPGTVDLTGTRRCSTPYGIRGLGTATAWWA